MDRKLKKKTFTPKRIGMGIGIFLIIGMFFYSFVLMDTSSRLNVERDRLMIYTVEEGPFQEYIDISGTVQPIRTVYMEAIEGGVVDEVLLQSGAMVEQGDTILTLSNTGLEMEVMDREANILDQINNIYSSRNNLEQGRLNLQEQLASARTRVAQLEPRYIGDLQLYENGYINEREYQQTKQEYDFERLRLELTQESFIRDSLQMINQLRHLEDTEERLRERLPVIQQTLDNLIVTAPITGQLTMNELDIGQSVSQRERIGQVDLLDGYKVRANIDEFYLPRITTGLTGSFSFAGETYQMVISRLFPVIQNGQFQVDLEFSGEMPNTLTRGQSVRVRIELDSTSTVILVERGGFYQSTGGNWIYMLVEDELQAVRQPIRLGRGNPQQFEVLEGLQPGDQVVTSSYATFGDNEVLVLE